MTAFENLRKASEAIIAICEKEQHTKEDKNKLLKIHQQISAAIEDLMECEACSRIVTVNQIATITLSGESAKLCKNCGIKSLEAGKLVKKKPSRRRTQRPKKIEKPETLENTGKMESSTSKTSAPKTEKPSRRQTQRSQKTEKPKTSENTGKMESSVSKTSAPKTEKLVPEPPKEDAKPNLNELYGEVEEQTGISKRDVKKIHKLIEEIAVPMDLENTIIYTVAELEKARMGIERPATEKAVSMLFKLNR